jgi:RNA polymerase sigma-70 factor (ECF subfamily)
MALITKTPIAVHSPPGMSPVWSAPVPSLAGEDPTIAAPALAPAASPAVASFLEIYRAHFPFVWRTVLQLGVDHAAVADAVQEVFVVVHRRYAEFEGRSSVRTWLHAIARRVVADHRKSQRRKPATPTEPTVLDAVSHDDGAMSKLEAANLVSTLLETLDDVKREVFVLAELEGMTVAEIAEATSANPNTVAARLRAARAAFECALVEHQSGERIILEGTPR